MMRLISAMLCLGFVFFAHAKQEFKVKDGDTVVIKLSSKEVNRIAMADGGRLNRLWGNDHLLVEVDKDKGEAYITPSPMAPTSFSFFVRDEAGSTFTIVAQQYDVPSETILLSSSSINTKIDTQADAKLRETAHVNNIKILMKAMALNKDLSGYKVDNVDQTIKFWKEVKLSLNTVYAGSRFKGEIYSLQNITKSEMRFNETEFLSFGNNIAAVALDKQVLQPSETAFLYIVRYGAKK